MKSRTDLMSVTAPLVTGHPICCFTHQSESNLWSPTRFTRCLKSHLIELSGETAKWWGAPVVSLRYYPLCSFNLQACQVMVCNNERTNPFHLQKEPCIHFTIPLGFCSRLHLHHHHLAVIELGLLLTHLGLSGVIVWNENRTVTFVISVIFCMDVYNVAG
jgi:hypothetical protein